MFQYKSGDMLCEDVQALVNTVNCVGVMGRGIALQFKKKYPENFRAYATACKHNNVKPGKMFVHQTGSMINPQWIINFPTKRHWRNPSRIVDIESGLQDLVHVIQDKQIKSIALPPLGAGLGGLAWPQVKSAIESTLNTLQDITIIIFEPTRTPSANKISPNRTAPNMTPGRAILVQLIHRYLEALLDPFITLLEVQKLMYFMQQSGEHLKLQYQQAPYGPYAKNLSHVLHRIEGYYTIGYADGGDNPHKELNLVAGAVEDAQNFLQDHSHTQQRFNRVSDLIDGFETPMGMELLATVHWAVQNMGVSTETELIDRVHGWNDRKKMFNERQIKLAHKLLVEKNWLPH